MDGGPKQDEMAARIKREVKEKAPRRGERRSITTAAQPSNGVREFAPEDDATSLLPSTDKIAAPTTGVILPLPEVPIVEIRSLLSSPTSIKFRNYDEIYFPNNECIMSPVGWSNNVLLMFYLDNVVPFLFPLYRPSLHRDGGRAWILEMVLKSPAIRQAILCQASVFYSLTQGTQDLQAVWETVMKHTGDAFAMLRHALQVRLETPLLPTPHCSVRLIAAIIQLQRFEIATLSFQNCQQHLNAALDLLQRLLNSHFAVNEANPKARFNALVSALRPGEWESTSQTLQTSSAEQAAFRFSTALLVVDDIVASTTLQETPRLYEYHEGILGDASIDADALNLETIVGCQNIVIIELGKVAALDAWKQQRKRAGNLDVMELAHRAVSIRDSLQEHLRRLTTCPFTIAEPTRAMMDLFTADYLERSLRSVSQVSVITRAWAHASMIYLLIAVSGWQPASPDVRFHVDAVLDLLSRQLSPPGLLRTVVWPLCVAGCLATPGDEARIREMVGVLRPSGMFGTVHKALKIMEGVWATRDSADLANRDIASCLRSQGELTLLV